MKHLLFLLPLFSSTYLFSMDITPDWQCGIEKDSFKWVITPSEDYKYNHYFIPVKNENRFSSRLHWKIDTDNKNLLDKDTTTYILALCDSAIQSEHQPQIEALSDRLYLAYKDYYYLSDQDKRTLLYLATDAFYENGKLFLSRGNKQFSSEMFQRVNRLPLSIKEKITSNTDIITQTKDLSYTDTLLGIDSRTRANRAQLVLSTIMIPIVSSFVLYHYFCLWRKIYNLVLPAIINGTDGTEELIFPVIKTISVFIILHIIIMHGAPGLIFSIGNNYLVPYLTNKRLETVREHYQPATILNQ